MKRLLTSILMLLSVMIVLAQQVVHTVQRGETLESIAQKYYVSVDALKLANPDAAELFYIGMKLNIPKVNESEHPSYVPQHENEMVETIQQTPSYESISHVSSNYIDVSESLSLKNTWHIAFRLGPSFYNSEKTGGMKKEYGYSSTYSQSWGFEAAFGAHYYILDNLYVSGMLGYNQASSSLSMNSIGSYNSTSVVSHNISMPIEVGAYVPISKNIGFVLEAGPTLLYAVDGYTKINKEKISFSKLEDDYDVKIDRFGAFLRVGGGFSLWGFRIQGYYGIPLSKFAGASEKKNFWGITLGSEM